MSSAESDSTSRLQAARLCLDEIKNIFIASGAEPNLPEKVALERADARLNKVASQRRERESNISRVVSDEEKSFSETFLEAFTTRAFQQEIDDLRTTEGESMTEADFATLADSIRNFGLFLSQRDREAFAASLETSKS